MIHTITVVPYIEKKVSGSNFDEIYFEMDQIQYDINSIGLKVSQILNTYNLSNKAYFLCSNKQKSFIENCLKKKQVDYELMEADIRHAVQVSFVEGESFFDEGREDSEVVDDAFKLFGMMSALKVEKNDICVMEYHEESLSLEAMSFVYDIFIKKHPVMFMNVSPKYYAIFQKHPANVLILDEREYCEYFKCSKKEALSSVIENIKKELSNLAGLVVYMVSYNDMIFFTKEEVIRIVCTMKQYHASLYREALIAMMVKCYMDDGSLDELRECVMLSTAMSLHHGDFVISEEEKAFLQKKIMVYRI